MREHQNKHNLSFHSYTQSVNSPPGWNCRVYWTGLAQSHQSAPFCTLLQVRCLVSLATCAGVYFTTFLLHSVLHVNCILEHGVTVLTANSLFISIIYL